MEAAAEENTVAALENTVESEAVEAVEAAAEDFGHWPTW